MNYHANSQSKSWDRATFINNNLKKITMIDAQQFKYKRPKHTVDKINPNPKIKHL